MSTSGKSTIRTLLTMALCMLGVISCKSVGEREPRKTGQANPKVEKLRLQPNFEAQHLYSPSENGQGSWVSMTFDDKGRLIASDQFGALYRLELPPIGTGQITSRVKVEKLLIQTRDRQQPDTAQSGIAMGYAQGLLWAFNSLYVVVNHPGNTDFPKSSGLYRLQDTDQDDQFDKITLLKALKGSGEHGPHSIILSPDKKSLYLVAGNGTDLPAMDAYRLPPVWQQDNMYPLFHYPSGGGEVNRLAPAGWIARVNPTGSSWELVGSGFRNPFGLAFNSAGDLFTYESDKELDLGMPWYQPTRIYHVTSGGEFGWRTGSTIWSPNSPDKLPAILNIGMGSPTSLISGQQAKFPEKYQQALFGFDWSFGIIYAIHLQPSGSSYTAVAEEFLSGSPLPLTSGLIGPDGALYFLTGGRKLDSDLYRVYYGGKGQKENARASGKSIQPNESHKIRTQLEQYHSKANAAAIDAAWPYLSHQDPFIRYAARIAIEHQPVSQWQERALQEKDPRALMQAMMALARHGSQQLQARMLNALLAIDFRQLPEEHQLGQLRALELVLLRAGKPEPAQLTRIIAYLDPHYPAKSNDLNRALSKILVFSEGPEVIEKTLALLDKPEVEEAGPKTSSESVDFIHRNPQYGLTIARMQQNAPPAQQVYYAILLSEAQQGWTPQSREKYFKWFDKAFAFEAGRNYIGYVNSARKRALALVAKDQYEHYDALSGKALVSSSGTDLAHVVKPKGPGRNWEMATALPLLEDKSSNRDFDQGKAMFAASLCSTCHGMQGKGGSAGPDLTQLGSRFSGRDILEAIIEPNKVISDQYASTVFYLQDGTSILGRLINENKDAYYLSQNPFAPETLREIPKKMVTKKSFSEVSIMPPGLINRLNEEEVKNLLAYLMAGGNQDNPVYKAKNQ
jgi:putative heme-binding domain-containing protein